MQLPEFLTMLADEIAAKGSAKKAAEYWGVSPQYLSDLLKGRREPGPKILDEFGLSKHVSYEPKDMSGIGFAQETDFIAHPVPMPAKVLPIEKEQQ